MAFTGIDTSSGGVTYGTGDFYNYVLNNLFLPSMADTVIFPNALLKRLPRDSTRVEGKNVVYPIHTASANGVVALGADGFLPEADSESYDQYSFGVRHIYVRMKFDGITYDASRTQLASWLKIVESEAKAKALNMARQRQRMYHNDGSGVLCEVVSHAAGPPHVLTVRVNQGIESPGTCTSVPTQHIAVGQNLCVYDIAATAVRFCGTVASKTNTTITFSQTGDLVDGTAPATPDVVCTIPSLPSALSDIGVEEMGYQNEPMGLAGLLSDTNPDHDTNFQGIDADAAGNDWHQANILANGAVLRPLTLKLMDLGWTTNIEVGDAVPTVIWSSFGLVREYADLLIADRRFQGTTTFDGGYDAVPYNGVPVLADRDMWKNRLAMVDETDLRCYVMTEPSWMDMDGSIYARITDKDAYQATMYCRETLGCELRDHHTLITDIQE